MHLYHKKISIIVPVYNSAQWLSQCIDSLLAQTYKNIEIILINDGSTDNSSYICDIFEKKDNRVKVLHQSNQGVSISRNNGIKIASGEYIQFVDSDDWIEDNMCETLIENIEKSKAELAICGLNITLNQKIIRTPCLKAATINYRDNEQYYWELRKINLGPCNKLYKRDKITNFFKENKSLGEDCIFVLDYMKNINRIVIVDACLYNVRLDNFNSLNRKYRSNRLELVLELIDYERKFYKKIYKPKCNLKRINSEFILAAHSSFREIVKNDSIFLALKKINFYKKNSFIRESSKNVIFNRLDYKIFNNLIRVQSGLLIYAFFKFKFLLLKSND